MQIFLLLLIFHPIRLTAQAPSPALVGYFHNWNDPNAPYIQLDQVNPLYGIIDVAFAVPQSGTDYKMEFIPDQVVPSVFISQIQTVQNQNRKVLISIGGATAPISLDNISERDTFVSTMVSILNMYGFDGMDIDLEGSSLSVSGGTIANPIDAPVINLIDAIRQIMTSYQSTHNKRMLLTMAPETAFVQGGQSAYGGIWGAYLPVIDALRDSIEVLHVQLYNSGSMYGIDGNIYTQGTADFIVAMSEAVIQGFGTTGGTFAGLPASKIAVGLPACANAAGGGFIDTATVRTAIHYLQGKGPQPGNYTLLQPAGYPDFRGMMTWSINWDAVAACGGSYSYAQNYQTIFGSSTAIEETLSTNTFFSIYPNPVSDVLYIQSLKPVTKNIIRLYNINGQLVLNRCIHGETAAIPLSTIPAGTYCLIINDERHIILKQ